MNRALGEHAPAAARGLALGTYEVMPLSEGVGLIEWVADTDTLKRLIYEQVPICAPDLYILRSMRPCSAQRVFIVCSCTTT